SGSGMRGCGAFGSSLGLAGGVFAGFGIAFGSSPGLAGGVFAGFGIAFGSSAALAGGVFAGGETAATAASVLRSTATDFRLGRSGAVTFGGGGADTNEVTARFAGDPLSIFGFGIT